MENYTTLKTQVKQVVAKFEDVTNSKKYTYHHRPPRALELVTHSLPWNILKQIKKTALHIAHTSSELSTGAEHRPIGPFKMQLPALTSYNFAQQHLHLNPCAQVCALQPLVTKKVCSASTVMSKNYKRKLHIMAGRVAQSLQRLATGWTVRGSNPGGRRDSSVPVQTGPGAHPASCTMGTGSFPRVKSGRGVKLTPHPILGPWS